MKKTIYLPLFIFVCLFQFPELAYSQDTGSFFILWDKEGRGDITAPFGPPVSHADIFQYEGQVIQQSVYDELKLQVVDGRSSFGVLIIHLLLRWIKREIFVSRN
jgi:hypothetical protein